MANEHGLFWNSQNGDRVYDANDFSEWLKKFYTTGVFNGDLEVTAAGGMTVSVSSGYVNIEGKVRFFSTPTTLTLATASGTHGRIDTVVAECNYTNREIKLKVVTGTYSISPTATAPVRTAAAYQLVLAQIDVAAGATEITQKNITDKRMDSNVCGLVTGTVSQIDFSTVKAQFDSWFEDVKGTLDSDAAGNLKNQIDAANEKIDTNTNNIATNTSAINTLNNVLTGRNAGFHNSIYRGKNLGTSVTTDQWNAIYDGTFDDLYIGDYWTIGGIDWVIAAFDYYLGTGDTECTAHHIVIVPRGVLYNAQMNSTNTTDGAYFGSAMYKTGLNTAKETINNAFGSAHILNHRNLLQDAVSNGHPSGETWYDSTVELMTEENVYGCKIFGAMANGSTIPDNYVVDKSQFPLFRLRPDMQSVRAMWYWLRDVVSAAGFADVYNYGDCHYYGASYSGGVRPAFCIC